MSSKRYPMKKIDKVPKVIALRLQRICYTTGKYQLRANECKNYLIALKLVCESTIQKKKKNIKRRCKENQT